VIAVLSPRFRLTLFLGWLLAAVVGLACTATPVSAQTQPDQHKKVLALYSLRRDAQFSITGERELPRVLQTVYEEKLDYYSEFIDVSRFPELKYRDALRDFLQRKYQDVRFDLVIAIQDMAVQFVEAERGRLFGDTPVVFVTNIAPPLRRPNSTGFVNGREFAGTLKLIRELQPDLEQLFIVSGASQGDQEYEGVVRRQLQPFVGSLKVTYLAGLPTGDLTKRLAKLPPHSAVYYIVVDQDGSGQRFHPLEYLDVVVGAANAPTYCWTDSAMDHGIVGGSLYEQEPVFEALGRLALRVLGGESPDNIPVSVLNLNVNQVSWRQLRRWRIAEARVPAGTKVTSRDPDLWERYKGYFLAAGAVLGTQSVLIVGLLLQRRRRRLAEEQLRSSQSELLKIYARNRDLGARLLQAQESERSRIAGELHDDICQRMLLLTMELESLRRSDERPGPAAEALTVAKGISKSLHELSHRLHPTRLRLIGLVGALEQLSHELSRAGVGITFTHRNVPALMSSEVMLCLFRTVQEALQNAIKYSGARDMAVHLIGGPAGLTLSVIDDGVGFDVEEAWGKGLGLASMSERLETVGGSLEIQSMPGEGTQVTASVPLHVLEAGDEVLAV
jgi:signal transduction histidine kinase